LRREYKKETSLQRKKLNILGNAVRRESTEGKLWRRGNIGIKKKRRRRKEQKQGITRSVRGKKAKTLKAVKGSNKGKVLFVSRISRGEGTA